MSTYRGRFAPSPTGPLHLGSLFAALISYLEARSHQGQWLLRIEDVDTQREQPEAQQSILDTLETHGLHWDEPVRYQSRRSTVYEKVLQQLAAQKQTYQCPCSRKQLQATHGKHIDACQKSSNSAHKLDQFPPFKAATKFCHKQTTTHWNDSILGVMQAEQTEDFVLKRKEGFYAYQLAVVCDDIDQGITHVIRGSDLLDSTPMQLALYAALHKQPPTFGHFPILLNAQQQKLSKQTYASAVSNKTPVENLLRLFNILRLPIKSQPTTASEALQMALQVWDKQYIPKTKSLKHTPTV